MTEDELVEKVAEAMWKARHPSVSFSTTALSIYEKLARAAIACVRENDKMVQADSTGAVRSTDLSVVKTFLGFDLLADPMMPPDACVLSYGRRKPAYVGVDFGRGDRTCEWSTSADGSIAILKITEHRPNVDRTAPVQEVEPNLPSSLLLKMVPKGGIQG